MTTDRELQTFLQALALEEQRQNASVPQIAIDPQDGGGGDGGFLDFLTRSLISEGVLDTIREQGLLGRFGANVLEAATDPIGIASTALIATGVGAPLGIGLRAGATGARIAAGAGARAVAGRAAGSALARVPVAGRPVAQLAGAALQPVTFLGPSLPARLLAEQVTVGGLVAGAGAAQAAGQVIPGPTRSDIGQTAIGVLGGIAGAGGVAGAARAIADFKPNLRQLRSVPFDSPAVQGNNVFTVRPLGHAAFDVNASTAGEARRLAAGQTGVSFEDIEAVRNIPRVGSLLPDGSTVGLSSDLQQRFNIPEIETGLDRSDMVRSRVREALGNPASDELTDQAQAQTRTIKENFKSQARVVSGEFGAEYRRLFKPDGNQIPSLNGVDPSLPASPTLQDVAARLPTFRDSLSPEQLDFMRRLREALDPYGRVLREVGDEFGVRQDVADGGGFYIPRGGAFDENAGQISDQAVRFARGGGRPSVEQSARFASQAEGIAEGWEYVPFETAVENLIRGAGARLANARFENFLRTVTDETGTRLGRTAKELLIEQNPEVARRMAELQLIRNRLSSALGTKSDQAFDAIQRFLDDPNFNDLNFVLRVLRRSTPGRTSAEQAARAADRTYAREAVRGTQAAGDRLGRSTRFTRGRNAGRTVEEVRVLKREAVREIENFRFEYDRALNQITSRNLGRIDIPSLQGRFYPERMAARVNDVIRQDRATFPRALEVTSDAQNLLKGMQATLDNSGVGIQALLSAFSNPRALSRAMRANIRSFASENAYGDALRRFNSRAAQRQTLSSVEWTNFGLQQLGRDVDILPSVASRLNPERLPLAGGVFRGSNRAFGAVSDVVRLEWADDLYMEEVAKRIARGLTPEQARAEILTDGTARQIANFANAATGFVRGRFSVSNLVTFSMRFLTSRLVTLGRAIRGIDIDAPVDVIPVIGPRVARNIPRVNPVARLEDHLARRAVLRMIGFGTMMTVALNEMQGRDTDFRPIVDGRPNSNFLRFRAFNRDFSLFGPWDSLARLLTSVGTGNFKSATRSVVNAPFASLGFDFIENRDFFGNPIIRPNATANERIEDVMARFAESMIPFAADEAPQIIRDIGQNATDGHLEGIGINIATGIAEGLGIKSSPLSNTELNDLLRDPNLSPELRAEILEEQRDRRARRRTGAAGQLGTRETESSRGSSIANAVFR